MITLRFWAALRRPPIQHPLFRRTTRRYQPTYEPPKRSSRAGLVVLTLGGMLFALILPQAIGIAILVIPLLITSVHSIFFGTLAGATVALRVGSEIAREQERGSLELLAVTPRGGFEAIWAICTGCQYYDQRLRGGTTHDVWFSRSISLGIMMIITTVGVAETQMYRRVPPEALIAILIMMILAAIAFQIDDMHSLVIGSLVGMLIPLTTKLHFLTLASFILLQVFAYGLTIAVGFGLVPLLLSTLRLDWFTRQLTLLLTLFLVFFASRELVARALWGAVRLVRGDLGLQGES